MDRFFKLKNGVKMPLLGFFYCFFSQQQKGLGTYKIFDPTYFVSCIEKGYRLLDSGSFYGNEKEVGEAVRKVKGIDRKDIFVTTKVWFKDSMKGYESVKKAFEISYKNFGLEYIDMYMIHWPGTSHNYVGSKEDNYKARKESWKAMEEIYKSGKVKAIGVSNFCVKHLKELFEYCEIKPMVNQCEMHVKLHQKELIKFCKENDIVFQAYSPFGKGKLFGNDVVKTMATNYKKKESHVLLNWILSRDVCLCAKSSNLTRAISNTEVFDFELKKEDLEKIEKLNEDWHCTWNPYNVK